jgi:8-oxo-dGTP diphosphatase
MAMDGQRRDTVVVMTDLGAFAALIDDEGRLLLGLRRDVELWEMPGGGVEPGESPWDAVRREVREEIGLEADVRRLIGMYSRPARDLLVLQFECGVSGDPTTSSEVREVRFFDLDALPEPMNPAVVERISDLQDRTTVHMRVQHGPSGREWAEAWKKGRAGTGG